MPRLPSVARPPFCPRPSCPFHHDPRGWRFKKKGFYTRRAAPQRVQRYRCSHCSRNFSTQTFHPTYWLRAPRRYETLFGHLVSCSALRQVARQTGCHPTTVMRHADRLGRHCLLLLERLRPRLPSEPLVLDGLRTLESGHYWPFDANLLVGSRSLYVYGFNEAELRRGGTMRPGQQRHRERLEQRYGRPDPRATEQAVTELVGRCVPPGAEVELWSDQHAAYPRALAKLGDRRIRARTVSSRAPRTATNPLFPVNLTDLLVRHDSANHKRETIAFSKRRQGAMYRLAIWAVWRNFGKQRSERRRNGTPAMALALGLTKRPWRVRDVLSERLFPSQIVLSGWLKQCYERRIRTRCLPLGPVHQRRYAQ